MSITDHTTVQTITLYCKILIRNVLKLSKWGLSSTSLQTLKTVQDSSTVFNDSEAIICRIIMRRTETFLINAIVLKPGNTNKKI